MGKILVVTDNKNGFTFRALCNEMRKAELDIIETGFEDENMDQYMQEVDLIFASLSNEFDPGYVFFSTFKKKYAECDTKMVVLGNLDKVEAVKTDIPAQKLIGSLIRPMDNIEVIVRTKKFLRIAMHPNQKRTILVVDDSGPMLRTIMGWLENDYEVVLANSAKRALDAINGQKPDLILLDYEMPICTGPQLLQMLREDESTSDIPVIFLTAQSDAESVKSVLALRPQGYILKTTAGIKVVEKIKEYFDSEM